MGCSAESDELTSHKGYRALTLNHKPSQSDDIHQHAAHHLSTGHKNHTTGFRISTQCTLPSRSSSVQKFIQMWRPSSTKKYSSLLKTVHFSPIIVLNSATIIPHTRQSKEGLPVSTCYLHVSQSCQSQREGNRCSSGFGFGQRTLSRLDCASSLL